MDGNGSKLDQKMRRGAQMKRGVASDVGACGRGDVRRSDTGRGMIQSMEGRASESWLWGRMELSRVEERRRRAKWVGR